MPDIASLIIARTNDSVFLSMTKCARSQKTLESSRRRLLPPMQGGSDSQHPTARETRSIEKTRDGRLPASLDTKLYAGLGTNGVCAGCDEKITPDETEFETDQTDDLTLRFHADCYRAWKFGSERREVHHSTG
jgi:hypothetical protein